MSKFLSCITSCYMTIFISVYYLIILNLNTSQGILSKITFNNKILNGTWSVTGFPLEVFNTENLEKSCIAQGPTFYTGLFMLPEGKEPLDTFLDTTGWGKVNINNTHYILYILLSMVFNYPLICVLKYQWF